MHFFHFAFNARRGNHRQVCAEQIALKKPWSHPSVGTSGTMNLHVNTEVSTGSCLIKIRP